MVADAAVPRHEDDDGAHHGHDAWVDAHGHAGDGHRAHHEPGSTLSPNVTSEPDTSAGAPPNTVIYGGKYDGNADGSDETTVDWRVTFANDPNDLFNGSTADREEAP
jgi:hypothetical protein